MGQHSGALMDPNAEEPADLDRVSSVRGFGMSDPSLLQIIKGLGKGSIGRAHAAHVYISVLSWSATSLMRCPSFLMLIPCLPVLFYDPLLICSPNSPS
ncbi:unnamed protein product [Merluccius merluccius]